MIKLKSTYSIAQMVRYVECQQHCLVPSFGQRTLQRVAVKKESGTILTQFKEWRSSWRSKIIERE